MVHDPLRWRMYAFAGFCVLLLAVNPIRRFMSINFLTLRAARWVTDHGESGTWLFNQSAAAVRRAEKNNAHRSAQRERACRGPLPVLRSRNLFLEQHFRAQGLAASNRKFELGE